MDGFSKLNSATIIIPAASARQLSRFLIGHGISNTISSTQFGSVRTKDLFFPGFSKVLMNKSFSTVAVSMKPDCRKHLRKTSFS